MAGSMDIENGLDRNAQESAEDLKCGTETKSASKAIVGFSMAILAGPPTWYHMSYVFFFPWKEFVKQGTPTESA